MSNTNNREIKLYRFSHTGYGLDLPFCALSIDDIKRDLAEWPKYREAFYTFILIEEGEARIAVGGKEELVAGPSMICGLPGELWNWLENSRISGKLVFFEPDFITSAIKDSLFMQRLGFLNAETHSPYIPLSEKGLAWIHDIIVEMMEELKSPARFVNLLQAQLWHLLLLMEKEYQQNGNPTAPIKATNYASAFVSLVSAEMFRHHDVEYYAQRLCITSNYLNKISNTNLGLSAGKYIQQRLISDAKSMLRIKDMTVKEIATTLGFRNISYFVRLFRQCVGKTPVGFRQSDT